MANGQNLWTGQLMDGNGRKGRIEVLFVQDKGIAAWKLQLFERDGEPLEIEGEAPFEGHPREPVRIESEQEGPNGGRVRWVISLEPSDPGMYAEAALVGTYDVSTEGADLPAVLGRGVLAIWQFGG
jgi:hypothetical protein